MQITLEQAGQLEINNNKERHKNRLKKKGENSLYAELKKSYPNGSVCGFMKTKDYVEMLKTEIAEEDAKNQQ